VVAAYRNATIGLADEVLFLVDGRIVDRGPHERLVRTNPAYARLVNAYESEPGSEEDTADDRSGDAAAAEVGR